MKYYLFYLACSFAFVVAVVKGDSEPCGGLLLGDYGKVQYPATDDPTLAPAASGCIWLVRTDTRTGIRLTVHHVESGSHLPLLLYAEQELISQSPQPISVNESNVGFPVEFGGKTLLIVLPEANAIISFAWESISEANGTQVHAVIDYIGSAEGRLGWTPHNEEERLIWIVNSNTPTAVSWKTDTNLYACEEPFPAHCFYFAIHELADSGLLQEVIRISGRSSEGTYRNRYTQLIALGSVRRASVTEVQMSWFVAGTNATSTTTTLATSTAETAPPPAPSDAQVLMTCVSGAYTMSLDTFQITNLSSTVIQATDVTFNAQGGKLYWAESLNGYSSLYRSNLDGSGKETLLDRPHRVIYALAYDWIGNNLYFGNHDESEIHACDAIGQKCAVVTTTLVDRPLGLALHPALGIMFWTNYNSNNAAVVRGAMDGSNATLLVQVATPRVAFIAVDVETSRIYYALEQLKAIESSDFFGADRRMEYQSSSGNLLGVDIFQGRLYWSNYANKKFQSCSLQGNNCTEVDTLVEFDVYARAIKIVHPQRQPQNIINLCDGKQCSHLCVIGPESYRCLCPQGMELGPDQKRCYLVVGTMNASFTD